MAHGRYDLSEVQCQLVQHELPLGKVKAGGRGRPARANREILNVIFWILCSGSPWRGLPERYGLGAPDLDKRFMTGSINGKSLV